MDVSIDAKEGFNCSARCQLTGILGLSAITYSCGGDGSRLGGGVDDSFLKYFAMPVGLSISMAVSSSVGGADDSDEESESEGAMLKGGCCKG